MKERLDGTTDCTISDLKKELLGNVFDIATKRLVDPKR